MSYNQYQGYGGNPYGQDSQQGGYGSSNPYGSNEGYGASNPYGGSGYGEAVSSSYACAPSTWLLRE